MNQNIKREEVVTMAPIKFFNYNSKLKRFPKVYPKKYPNNGKIFIIIGDFLRDLSRFFL